MDARAHNLPAAIDHPLWQGWYERAYSEDMERYPPPLCLHHYVRSYDSLVSILQSRTIWASDVQSLNDSTEFEHGLATCVKALELIREPAFRKHVEIVKLGLRERFLHQTFVACFSTFNDVKSQWDDYADSQRGFVITFDALVLSALKAPLGMRFMPVEYGETTQVNRARESVERAVEDLNRCLPTLLSADVLYAIHSRFTLLAVELFYLCTSFKDVKWSCEREWRLIYTRTRSDTNALPVQTRIAGDREVKYVALDLTSRYFQFHLPAFASVRAGPIADRNSALLVQRYLLESEQATRWEEQPAFP
jgi:hypothetical protein